MGACFATLEQAEKHVHEKNTMWSGKIGWYIVDCNIGFLVISEAQGSSALNRGHEHHRAIRRFRVCEGRPRRLGGVQRGGGT